MYKYLNGLHDAVGQLDSSYKRRGSESCGSALHTSDDSTIFSVLLDRQPEQVADTLHYNRNNTLDILDTTNFHSSYVIPPDLPSWTRQCTGPIPPSKLASCVFRISSSHSLNRNRISLSKPLILDKNKDFDWGTVLQKLHRGKKTYPWRL